MIDYLLGFAVGAIAVYLVPLETQMMKYLAGIVSGMAVTYPVLRWVETWH